MVKAALFLDRDGVINVDRHYVWRIEDFEFVPGIFELVEAAVQGGLLPIVVTNQAGIGRGYYTERDFRRLDDWMHAQFRERGAAIARTYHCPFHPTEGIGAYRRESFDRKPNPGMLLQARADFDLELSNSVLVGDKDSDIEAGRAAGVRHNVKVVHDAHDAGVLGMLEFPDLGAVRGWLRETRGIARVPDAL
jgi:D-glycero-D-manno-heptose 1,7-bisphosphate phosphatase